MKKQMVQILGSGILFLILATQLWAVSQNNYQLGVGDTIEIKVFGEEDLSLETTIDDDGVIVYPFIGKIQVLGMSLSQLQSYITDFLKGDYLVNPNVNVTIKEYRKFYIRGEVSQPGSYPYYPGLTINKAVSIAGGFTERAARNKIYIIHENGNKNKPIKVENYYKIKPGDIVIVKQSFF